MKNLPYYIQLLLNARQMATSLELRVLAEFYSILFRNMLQILAWLHYNTL